MKTAGDRSALVLMSGGVDSAVAAALLVREGWAVTGLTLRLWREEDEEGFWEAAREAAARTAGLLGLPHLVADLRETFLRQVVEPFVAEYARGRTPNPCVLCNPRIKFAAALEAADRLGIRKVASGHYARIVAGPRGPRLARGACPARDQSYFLHRLPPAVLGRVLFPLGGLDKARVRSLARDLSLPPASREDSQEVCFLEGRPEGFLARHLSAAQLRPGDIALSDGSVLGRHGGIHRFTVGQRRGLGVAGGRPLYVVAIDPGRGVVTVGGEEELLSGSLVVGDVSWAVDPPPEGAFKAMVKLRHRHEAAPALVTPRGGEVGVDFLRPQRAATPGQSAVFHDGDTVLGGGVIAASLRWTEGGR